MLNKENNFTENSLMNESQHQSKVIIKNLYQLKEQMSSNQLPLQSKDYDMNQPIY